MKVIRINTPEGQYDLPLKPIAEDRANYYVCSRQHLSKDSKEWKDEVEFAMNDDFEAIDWLINNYDWCDWSYNAVKVNSDVNVTDEDFWTSSEDFEIISK